MWFGGSHYREYLSTGVVEDWSNQMCICDDRRSCWAHASVRYIEVPFSSRQVGRELYRAFTEFEENDAIGAVVYTGGEKIFTVGADITEMKDFSFPGIYWDSFGDSWNKIHDFRKPVIAAVNGYCVQRILHTR